MKLNNAIGKEKFLTQGVHTRVLVQKKFKVLSSKDTCLNFFGMVSWVIVQQWTKIHLHQKEKRKKKKVEKRLECVFNTW